MGGLARSGAINGPDSSKSTETRKTSKLEPAGTLTAKFRTGAAPQLQNQIHHASFDLIANLAMFGITHRDRVGHFPIHNPRIEGSGQVEAAHIDDQVELGGLAQMPQTLGEV